MINVKARESAKAIYSTLPNTRYSFLCSCKQKIQFFYHTPLVCKHCGIGLIDIAKLLEDNDIKILWHRGVLEMPKGLLRSMWE